MDISDNQSNENINAANILTSGVQILSNFTFTIRIIHEFVAHVFVV